MQKRSKDRSLISNTPLLILGLTLSFVFFWLFNREPVFSELTYGQLCGILLGEDSGVRYQIVKLDKGQVRGKLTITDAVSEGTGPQEHKPEVKQFRTRIDMIAEADVLKLLAERAHGALHIEEEDSFVRGLISMVVMVFALVLAGILIVRWFMGGNSPLTFGRSRHKLHAQKDLETTFADVAGIDEAVAELREIVDFLKNPQKYQVLGGRIPKGVLLVGPPGTGKTLLARAVAGEADVAFFSMSGSDFVEMFVGVGASRVRDLFGQAESRAPCIIFIDELDALGKTRGVGSAGGHDEREQTLNQLLVEMDGFDSNRGVIMMAASNRPETLDPALLRPGRFDRTVVVDRPDLMGREAILKVHVRNYKLAEDVDLRQVASLTPGSVGADLANIVNEAALIAARNNRDSVTRPDFNEAIERGAVGLERKSRIMSPDEKQRVAYHEAGHAMVACALPNTHTVHKVSIIPRGVGALGYMWSRPESDRYLKTQSELESQIKVALGGTLAEELVYGEISSGATNDLENANATARHMVKEFGMSRMGRLNFRDAGPPAFLNGTGFAEADRYSEQTAREIDLEVRRILDEATHEVRGILLARRPALEALAKRLMDKEVVDGEELRLLIGEYYAGPKLVPASTAVVRDEGRETRGDERATGTDIPI